MSRDARLCQQYRLSLFNGARREWRSTRLIELISPRFMSCEGKKGKKLSAILEDDPSCLQYDCSAENTNLLLRQLDRMIERREFTPLPVHFFTYQGVTSYVAGDLLGALCYLRTYGIDAKVSDIPHRFVLVELSSDKQTICVDVMTSQVKALKEPVLLFSASSLAVVQFKELSRTYCEIHYTIKDFLNDNPAFLPNGMKHCPL